MEKRELKDLFVQIFSSGPDHSFAACNLSFGVICLFNSGVLQKSFAKILIIIGYSATKFTSILNRIHISFIQKVLGQKTWNFLERSLYSTSQCYARK